MYRGGVSHRTLRWELLSPYSPTANHKSLVCAPSAVWT